MPRHSRSDREIADGPWPLGLNNASDERFVSEGQVPDTLDCEVTLGGGISKRLGLRHLAANPNDSRSVCVLMEYLHDGRIVIGMMYNHGNAEVFDTANSRIDLYALPLRTFLDEANPFTNAVKVTIEDLSGTSNYNYPQVARIGGRTYLSVLGNIAKWDGAAWTVLGLNSTGTPAYDDGIIGYWTRQREDGVPVAQSDIRAAGVVQTAPTDPDDRTDGGGGFPLADLISLYQVGDRQVLLAAYDDKIRYSFATPYGVGPGTGDASVYGPQDWLEDAWMDVGESGSFDYVTAFVQVENTLFVLKRSSIWRVYGNLAPGGLRVEKIHEGIGVRHSGLVTSAGRAGIVFFDLVSSSLWSMSADGTLTDLWNQRIETDLTDDGTGRSFVFNSFVQFYHNRVYASIPTDGDPKMRTYVTDLTTGAIMLWSYGSSYLLPVEFFGNYGLASAVRITGFDGGRVDSEPGYDGNPETSFAWVVETSRDRPMSEPQFDHLGTDIRHYEGIVQARTLVPSLPGDNNPPDWSAVEPKWRRGLVTASSEIPRPQVMELFLNGTLHDVVIPPETGPTQIWTGPIAGDKSPSMEVVAHLPGGVTLHRVALRYWRRR